MSVWKRKVDASIQDQHTAPFKFNLIQYLKEDITLTSPVAVGDVVVDVSAGHGFVTGDDIVFYENGFFNQCLVVNVNVNAITIDTIIDKSYSVAAQIARGNRHLNVNGSATPIEFKFKGKYPFQPIDLQKIIVLFQSGNNQPDDSKFGGITALTNGITVHKHAQAEPECFSLGVYKTNKDFKDYGGRVEYTTKGAGGTYGTDVTIDIKDIYGVVIRLGRTENEEISAKVRDDLRTLSLMNVVLVGHYTEGER